MMKEELPIDRGWAWVVCGATFIITYLISNSFQVLAVILLDLTVEFNTSLTTVSFIFMVKTFCVSFASIISVNFLVPKFGMREVCTVSGFVYFICGVSYAFTSSIEMFIALATIRGITMGIISVPALSLLGFYFDKRRSVATTIAVCGASVAAISWPRFTRYIMSVYDLQGTLLLNGALEGNVMVSAMLLRPVSCYSIPKFHSENSISSNNQASFDVKNNKYSTGLKAASSTEENQKSLIVLKEDPFHENQHDAGDNYNLVFNRLNSNKPSHDVYQAPGSKNAVKGNTVEDYHHDQEEISPYSLSDYSSIIVTKTSVSSLSLTNRTTEILENANSHTLPIYASLRYADELQASPKDFLLSSRSVDNIHPSHDERRELHVIEFNEQNIQANSNKHELSLLDVFHNKSSSTSFLENMPGVKSYQTSSPHVDNEPDLSHEKPVLADTISSTDMGTHLSCWRKLHQIVDFSLFKQWPFLWILLAAIPCGTNMFIFTYLPTIATLKGVSKDDGALLLSILGAVDLCSRMVISLLADSKFLRITTVVGVSGLCLGFICLFVELYESMTSLLAMSVALGLFVGIRSSLITVMFIEVLGLERMAKAFSMFTVVVTLSVAGHTPLMGHMLESSGVSSVMHYMGCSLMLGGLMIYSTPLVKRLEMKYKTVLGDNGES